MTTTPDNNSNSATDFSREAEEPSPGLLREIWDLLRYNKKWWLVPIVVAVLLGSLLVFLSSTVFAPFAEPAGLDKPTLLALLTIPVVVLVWLMVRRIRARLGHRSGDQV